MSVINWLDGPDRYGLAGLTRLLESRGRKNFEIFSVRFGAGPLSPLGEIGRRAGLKIRFS